MKTVIIQTLWGSGILFRNKATRKNMRALHTYCIPSVRRYAERHGYSYFFHRTDTPHFRFSIDEKTVFAGVDDTDNPAKLTSVVSDDQFNACFERYYAMNGCANLYDRFIYLDLDVYIKPNAPAMPHTKGVWAFHEWQLPYEYNLWRGFSEVPDKHQFNSGVLVMDRKGVKSMYDYLCKTKPDHRCTGDQDYLRLWSLKNKVNHLDGKWNYLVRFHKGCDGYFIHYTDKRRMHTDLPPWYERFTPRCYEAIKNCERWVRHTRIFRFFRHLWKNRARA